MQLDEQGGIWGWICLAPNSTATSELISNAVSEGATEGREAFC